MPPSERLSSIGLTRRPDSRNSRASPATRRTGRGHRQGLSDLLPVVRDRLYNPGFEFSNSIKSAAQALCPDVTYGDLDDITDCAWASTVFWQMAGGRGTFRQWVERMSSLRTKAEIR